MATPQTRYVEVDGSAVAYQVVGEGDLDIVFVADWCNHVEAQWEDPINERFLHRLASLGRLIVFDKRGTGLSDPMHRLLTTDEWAEDLHAVLDAVASVSSVLVCASGGAALGLPFAAGRPERVSGLVLIDAPACVPQRDDYPAGAPQHLVDQAREWISEVWGTGGTATILTPSRADDRTFVEWRGRYERLSASPGTARQMLDALFSIDVRAVLTSVRAPTLVLHRRGDRWVRVDQARYLASVLPDSTLVELPGSDHLWLGTDYDDLLAEITEFVTGVRPPAEPDRVLRTIMFTDVVTSTEHAAALGDARWTELLDRHNLIVDRQLDRFHGERIKSTGDGVLASFDGPARAIRCAVAMRDALRAIGLPTRIGLHTGECELRHGDIGGLAVHIAARVAGLASADEVLVSGVMRDLVAGSSIRFDAERRTTLKGVPGEWSVMRVTTV